MYNTIGCALKAKEIYHNWQEIVRIGYNTQRVIATVGLNKAEVKISIRKSEPTEKLKEIQIALNIKSKAFEKL
ncbi:MAG: hypothetical protein EAY66_04130 [Sphingobacteriales bacterium]|nr:MAG: hypothetical protein EAY66_04130 [Sphingobacteriales bacterium]